MLTFVAYVTLAASPDTADCEGPSVAADGDARLPLAAPSALAPPPAAALAAPPAAAAGVSDSDTTCTAPGLTARGIQHTTERRAN